VDEEELAGKDERGTAAQRLGHGGARDRSGEHTTRLLRDMKTVRECGEEVGESVPDEETVCAAARASL
jgi:hypothetical protein